jgi:predicted RND superfamily exporter protein
MDGLGRWARAHGVWVLLLALLLTVPCGFYLRDLQIESNLLNVFPADDPAVSDFRYFSENFGVSDMMVVVLKDGSAEADEHAADFSDWLEASGLFTWVERQRLPGDGGDNVVLAYPRETSMNQPFCVDAIARVRAYLADRGIEARMTGAPVMVAESTESTFQDAFLTGALATVLVVVVLIAFFRDPLLPFVVGLPVAAAIAWGVAFAKLVYGRIDLTTAALPTALIGIGIDYALHTRASQLAARRSAGRSDWSAVYGRVVPPLFVGMATSAIAFIALTFARIPSLRQMGLTGAVTLALIFVICVLTMPVILDWRDRLGVRGKLFPADWLARIAHASRAHKARVITAFAIVTMPLLVAATRITVTVDPLAYMNRDLPSIRLYGELAGQLNISSEPLLVATPDLEAEGRVLTALADLIGPGQPFLKAECISRQSVTRTVGPQLDRFVGKDMNLCMILHPSFDPYRDAHAGRVGKLVAEIRERGGDDVLRVSGPPVVYMGLLHMIRRDMLRVSIAAAIGVVISLTVLMRRWDQILPALVPLAGGVVWMLGLLHLTGGRLTAANVVATPLVLGLGIDYGVHIVHRLRNGSVEEAVSTTGRAIVVASATTAGAFAMLCLGHSEAFIGMGLAAAVGIGSCLVWSLVLLPALLHRPGPPTPLPSDPHVDGDLGQGQ